MTEYCQKYSKVSFCIQLVFQAEFTFTDSKQNSFKEQKNDTCHNH